MKTILITGVTSGLGYAIAKIFVGHGWIVLGIGQNQRRLNDMSLELGEGLFVPIKVDISDPESLEGCLNSVFLIHPSIDVLINNAGIFKQASYESCSINDIGKIIDINLKGAMYCTYYCLPYLKSDAARIINISSVATEEIFIILAASLFR